MKIVISGLGRMGMQIAEKLAHDGHKVIAHNRSADKVDHAVSFGAVGAYSKQDVAAHYANAAADEPAVVWIMLPAAIIESELAEWMSLLPKGTIYIDGGNSDYRLTRRHAETVHAGGSVLVDVGTSGGVTGLKDGFCMMAGGDQVAYEVVEPALRSLAQPNGGYHYFGETGSGHYVKMVHNAIEYGMMESLAEGYRMLHEGAYKDLDLAAAGHLWEQNSIVRSGLNALSAEALSENPTLQGIDGSVAESGEARWTLETARDLGIPLPSIQAAFDVRIASQSGTTSFATKLLAAQRNKFGGHVINDDSHSESHDDQPPVEEVLAA